MRRVSVHVAPLPPGEGAAARAVAFFLDNGPSLTVGEAEDVPASDELRQLHGELKAAQEAALAGRIGHEAALQELRAGNEELQSLNEEYRSTAEELETSKEELQSINEELQTVNAELKVKLATISAAHDDLQNLTTSSEIVLVTDADCAPPPGWARTKAASFSAPETGLVCGLLCSQNLEVVPAEEHEGVGWAARGGS